MSFFDESYDRNTKSNLEIQVLQRSVKKTDLSFVNKRIPETLLNLDCPLAKTLILYMTSFEHNLGRRKVK